jgi:hypothetical protein
MLCRHHGANDRFRTPLQWAVRCQQARGGRMVLPWKEPRTAPKKETGMKKTLLSCLFSEPHRLSPSPVLQASADTVQLRMYPTTPVGLKAAPCHGVAQRPIGFQGISMQSLSESRSIR